MANHSFIAVFVRRLREPMETSARIGVQICRRFPLLDRLFSSLAVLLMRIYRKHLSPRKGYRCAHVALNGASSCSDVALVAFSHAPFAQAVDIINAQFDRCRQAYHQYEADLIGQALQSLPELTSGNQPVCCCCEAPKEEPVEPP